MERRLCLDDFEIGKELGSGQFGEVMLAREKRTGFIVALKRLSKRKIMENNCLKLLRREIDIQMQLRHPNILRLYGYFWDEQNVYLVVEYAYYGQLYGLLQEQTKFNEKKSAEIVADVVKALEVCHARDIMHRDIKPENIVVDHNWNLKLIDFGWSIQSISKRNTYCGTLDYMSPELLNDLEYDKSVDLWSIGVLAYELTAGYAPFKRPTEAATRQAIRRVMYRFPEDFSLELRDFISQLLKFEPRERMPLREASRHPWITSNISTLTSSQASE